MRGSWFVGPWSLGSCLSVFIVRREGEIICKTAGEISGVGGLGKVIAGRIGACRDESCWTKSCLLSIEFRSLPGPQGQGTGGTLGVVFGTSRPRPPAGVYAGPHPSFCAARS